MSPLSCLFRHEMTFPHQYALYRTSFATLFLVMYSDTLRSFAIALTDFSGFLSIVFWAFCTDLGVLMLLAPLACVLRLFAAIRYLSVAPSSFQTSLTDNFQDLAISITVLRISGNDYGLAFHLPNKLAVWPYLSEKRR